MFTIRYQTIGYSVLMVLLVILFFALSDELVMGSVQRRMGSFNSGFYGIISLLTNGCNPIISKRPILKAHYHYIPLPLKASSTTVILRLHPIHFLCLIDFYLNFFVSPSSPPLIITFITGPSSSRFSKHLSVGCIRITN